MGKAAIATPLYLSVAWSLMISYQLFTQTAVATIITTLSTIWPSAATWMSTRSETIIFIYAFAWVFVLSSVIPSVLLGKGRSVLIQFIVCLTLTFAAFLIQDWLAAYAGRPIDQLFSLATLFQNPILATGYLLMPYILMISLDIRARKKNKHDEAKQTQPPTTPVEKTTQEQPETPQPPQPSQQPPQQPAEQEIPAVV